MLWNNRRQLRESAVQEINVLSSRYRVDIFLCGDTCLYCRIVDDARIAGALEHADFSVFGGEQDGQRVHAVHREININALPHDRAHLIRLADAVTELAPRSPGLDLIRRSLQQPADPTPLREALHLGAVASALHRVLAREGDAAGAMPPSISEQPWR